MRGIRVGTVEKILVEELARLTDTEGAAFPVLIRIEPGRFQVPDSPEGVQRLTTNIEESVPNGLRATLQSGNLLTGSLVVSLEYYPDGSGGIPRHLCRLRRDSHHRGGPGPPRASGGRVARQDQ